ncbi:hypothetical protein K474DRAFT_462881 [Panus rudis PR-1116 ss-1]|nr:hypothetical protein K474DRAFT_462881 [Panus rudis PR-1116 ss-1]
MATQSQLEMSEKRPTLCVDVLVHVMTSLCKNGDVVNMMSTCRDLHVHGLRILLSQPLSLRASGQRSQEILAYILADKSRRPRLLRSLEVVTPGSSHGAALSEVLRYSTNLRELTLNLKGASIPEGLSDAIGTLASLRHLFINAGSFTEKILAAVHTPLTSLKLVGNRHSALLDLYTLIAPFADSLQDLNASNVTIRPFPVQFPRLHRLSLRIPQHPLCRQILSAAFPNAQSLFLDTKNLASDVDPLSLILEEQDLRSSNRSETRTLWKSLQTVHGDIATLHRLGLESTTQCLVLDWSPIADIDHYAAVFSTLQPRLLAFTSSSCRLVDWKEILEKAPYTTHLHFTNVIRPPRNGTIPAYVICFL